MYLHEDRELFIEAVESAAEALNLKTAVVEKDYYVTMILKLLSEKLDNVVFKGGTSLSKGFHAISRFSEDIDITFTQHIGEARRKKLKYNVMKVIGEEMGLCIGNWNDIESDKDYNYYLFEYEPIKGYVENSLLPGVKVETALSSYAFPTVKMEIDSYIRQFLIRENKDLITEYGLDLFPMRLQALERTYIDKIFALCDYFMEGKSKRYSRHLYDIYKLTPMIHIDDDFRFLVKEVREHRSKMKICPSAKDGVDIQALIHQFCAEDFFKSDYNDITDYFVDDMVKYTDAIETILELADKEIF